MSWYPTARTRPVAHRGYSKRAPENTWAAFREAIDAGASHVECDVHASAEGTPYVIHDAEVSRTTNGRGSVAELRDAELDALDAGAWKDSRYAGEPVPRLRALLERLTGSASLALEVKAPRIEEAVLTCVSDSGFSLGALTLFAFDFESLLRFRALEPQLHCTALVDRVRDDTEWSDWVARARDEGMRAIGPGDYLVTQARVEAAQDAGLSVFVWTVDDPQRMRELSGFGVDAVMTNDPALALETLGRRGH